MKKVVLFCFLVFGIFGLAACSDEKIPVFKINDGISTILEINTEEPDWKNAYVVENISEEVNVTENVDMSKVGTYEVIYTYKFGKKDASYKLIVNVVDTMAPEITVDSSKPISFHEGSEKPNIVEYFKATDNGDGEIQITGNMIVENIDMNKVGSYLVQANVKDSANNMSTKNITINIVDITMPLVLVNLNGLPLDFVVTEGIDSSFTEYFMVIDNEDGVIEVTDNMITHNIDIGVIGEYMVNLSVTDSSGNTATVTLPINIIEMPAPVVSVESNYLLANKSLNVEADRIITAYSLNGAEYVELETPSLSVEINELVLGKNRILFKGERGAITDSLEITVLDAYNVVVPIAESMIAYDNNNNSYNLQDRNFGLYIQCSIDYTIFEIKCNYYLANENGFLMEIKEVISSKLYQEGSSFILDDASETGLEFVVTSENYNTIQTKMVSNLETGLLEEYIVFDGNEYLIEEYNITLMDYVAFEYYQSDVEYYGLTFAYELDNGTFYIPFEGDNVITTELYYYDEIQLTLNIDSNNYLAVAMHELIPMENFEEGIQLILEDGSIYEVDYSNESFILDVYGELKLFISNEEVINIIAYQIDYKEAFAIGVEITLIDSSVIIVTSENEAYIRFVFGDENLYLFINDEEHIIVSIAEKHTKPILQVYWVGKVLSLSDGTTYTVVDGDEAEIVMVYEYFSKERNDYVLIDGELKEIVPTLSSRDINTIYNVGDILLLENGTTYTVVENDTTQLLVTTKSSEYYYHYYLVIDGEILEILSSEAQPITFVASLGEELTLIATDGINANTTYTVVENDQTLVWIGESGDLYITLDGVVYLIYIM